MGIEGTCCQVAVLFLSRSSTRYRRSIHNGFLVFPFSNQLTPITNSMTVLYPHRLATFSLQITNPVSLLSS